MGEVLLGSRVVRFAVIIEDFPGLSHRDDQRHCPPAQRSDNEFHCVDRLKPLRATGSADQADDLLVR